MLDRDTWVITSPYLYKKRKQASLSEVRVYDFLADENREIPLELSRLLEHSAPGIPLAKLVGRYPPALIDLALRSGYLLPRNAIWSAHRLQAVEIETSTVCNWRCEYCPSRWYPRRPEIMGTALFSCIAERIAAVRGIRYVALHLYNEPTLDPWFRWRVRELTARGLPLSLSTNGERLDPELVDFLKAQQVYAVTINFPAADPGEFERITGSRHYDRVVRNIRYALSGGLPVRLSVPTGRSEEVKRLFDLPSSQFADFETVDRAGLLKNQYDNHVSLYGKRLCGCILLNQRLYLNVRGECLMCCQDFMQTTIYGSIGNAPLDAVFGDGLRQIRKKAGGVVNEPDDFLCVRCQIMKSNLNRLRFMIPYQRSGRSGAALL